jgi:hypothetical protein
MNELQPVPGRADMPLVRLRTDCLPTACQAATHWRQTSPQGERPFQQVLLLFKQWGKAVLPVGRYATSP